MAKSLREQADEMEHVMGRMQDRINRRYEEKLSRAEDAEDRERSWQGAMAKERRRERDREEFLARKKGGR